MSTHHYRRNYNSCFIQPLFGGRLLLLDRPQVGKPTWGYDYTTALRRLPSPSDCHHHRPQKTAPHRHAPMARCIAIAKNRRSAVIYVSTGLACLPRDTMSAHCYRRSAVAYVSSGLDRLPRDTVLLALQKQAKPGITAGLQYCSAITGRTVLLKEPIIWLP